MLTIILSAGQSQRFLEAGYAKQKSMLFGPDGKRTVLEYQIDELRPDFLALVFLKSQRQYVYDMIFKISRKKNKVEWLKLIWHIWLDETSGPIDTARQSVPALASDSELLISYNDVIIPADTVNKFVHECQGFEAGICVFESDNSRFQRDPTGQYCNSGLFYFKSGDIFDKLVTGMPAQDHNGLPDLVYKSKSHHLYLISDFVDIGVPEDYERWAVGN